MAMFGRSRKKELWEIINGMSDTQDGRPPPYAEHQPREVQQEYDPGGEASAGPEKGFNWGRAAAAFFGGQPVADMFKQRDAKQEQEEALGQLGYDSASIKALRASPTALAQVLAERYQRPRPEAPNDTERDYQFILQTRGKEAADAFLDNKANPTRYIEVDDGQGGKRIIPVGGPQGVQSSGPQPGMVKNGYRFKGGNPNDPSAWEEVGGAGSAAPRTFRSPY